MRSYGKIFLALCLAGFVGGILYANTGARDHILAAGIFSDYFLEQYTQAEIQTQDYFWYILSVRAGLLGVIALMGQMKKLRRWIVAAVLVWTGFLGGLFFTAAPVDAVTTPTRMAKGGMDFLYSGANIPISSSSFFRAWNFSYRTPSPSSRICLA